MGERIISLGEIHISYIYILLSVICFLINDALYGFNHNKSFKDVLIFPIKKEECDFSVHKLIQDMVSYIGTFILGIIFHKIENKKSRKEISKIKINKRDDNDSDFLSMDVGVYLKQKIISRKVIFTIIIILVLWVLEEYLIEFYSKFLKDLDFWPIELIIISIMNSKMFNKTIFRHQKLVFFINIIPCILKMMTIILSLYDKEDIIYVNNPLYIFGIIFYFLLIILRSIVNSKIKWFMDLKYYSLNKLLIMYGLIGAIFSLIACFLSTYINCSDIFCKVKNENNNNYYDNFKVYYYKFKSAKKDKKIYEILIKIIGCISFFFISIFLYWL